MRPQRLASISSAQRDVRLEVSGTQPAFQLYTGDQLGAPFCPRAGLCVESQQFPDAPNHPHFPCALVRVGQRYRAAIGYAFDVD